MIRALSGKHKGNFFPSHLPVTRAGAQALSPGGMTGLDPFLRASTPFYLVWRGPLLESSFAGFPVSGQVPRERSGSLFRQV